MAEVTRWSGNDTTNISLHDDELNQLYAFVKKHEDVYIFGKGKIGQALGHYMTQAQFPFCGYVESASIEKLQRVYAPGRIGVLMGISDIYFPDVMPLLDFIEESDIFCLTAEKRESMGRIFSLQTVKENFWINIFVTNQCNLNCKSCSTFAPICAPDQYELVEFKNDIERLKEINLETISVIKFTGGEPFLHKDLFAMFEYARKLFPDMPMECYTNGLLLGGLSEERYRQLAELKITLIITEYPLENLNLTRVYEKAERLGVSYCVIYSEGQKYFSKRPLNFQKSTPAYMFYYCPRYKMCDSLFLYKGKLHKCIYVLASQYFNQAFGKNLQVSEKDCLGVYSATAEQVYEYCISRLPYCGYCVPIEELVPWGLSEKKIEEWTI